PRAGRSNTGVTSLRKPDGGRRGRRHQCEDEADDGHPRDDRGDTEALGRHPAPRSHPKRDQEVENAGRQAAPAPQRSLAPPRPWVAAEEDVEADRPSVPPSPGSPTSSLSQAGQLRGTAMPSAIRSLSPHGRGGRWDP